MAIQTHFYSSQDYFFMENNNINNNNMNNINNNLLYNQKFLQQEQQLQYQQHPQQHQYMMHLQNMQKRNIYGNNNSFMFLQPSKKQKLVNNSAATTTTIAATTASTTTTGTDNHASMSFSEQLEKQRLEIDRFITLQNERLRWALQEQRRQQIGAIIKNLEAKAMQLVRQKDDEIAEATKKSMEFQEIVRKLEIENQEWQRVALENESMVLSLNNSLEQLKHQQQQGCSSSSSNVVDDSESCCHIPDNKKETCVVGETGENREITTKEGYLCKVCNSRNSSVLILPCRHLCCCIVCDAVLDACPVCKSPKMASIQVFIS